MEEKREHRLSRPTIFFFAGLLVLAIGAWLSQKSHIPIESPIHGVLITLTMILWGSGGFLMTKEKLFPGFGRFFDISPVFSGYVVMALAWIMAIYTLWKTIAIVLRLAIP